MQATVPLTRELLLIGGGHAHALVLRMWGMRPLGGVRLTVVNPGPTAPYTGMLPGYVAGHYERDDLDIDLVRLARFAGARLILDKAIGIDPDARTVQLAGGRQLPYHVASVDIGITSKMPQLQGFAEYGIPAKPLDVYARRWSNFRQSVRDGHVPSHVAVIGGGVGGVELSLAMHHALSGDGGDPKVTLIESSTALKGLGQRAKHGLLTELAKHQIDVIENQTVQAVVAHTVQLSNDRSIQSEFTVGAAGARPHPWLADTPLDLTDGFVTVDKHLRSASHPDIYAVGDCAHLAHAPRPKAGVFAVRQAPVLYENLRAALAGGKQSEFHPQKDYLKLISLGEKSALADKWRMRLQGKALWRWKDRIDQKFMDQFRALKPMALPPLPEIYAKDVPQAIGTKPLCGGCGSKVGGDTLGRVLDRLPQSNRTDVLSEPGDDAAILAGNGNIRQTITMDHLRAFTEDPWLMSRIAAVHALGDIWSMGATPQVALSTLILPRMSPELQENYLNDIMAAAHEVFSAVGAEIVGGHTSMGSELTIGFTVTGLTESPITLAGAKPGDVLILTKPIGTGTILAAEMGLQANGNWVEAALNSMARPQADAANLLKVAHTMTDVTGFGLAGHLKGIAKASGIGIGLSLKDIPFLEGAVELSKSGVRSTIYPDNRLLVPEIVDTVDPRINLLFDPQTAGGLVAVIDAGYSDEILSKLKALRYDAKIIGDCRADIPTGTIQIA